MKPFGLVSGHAVQSIKQTQYKIKVQQNLEPSAIAFLPKNKMSRATMQYVKSIEQPHIISRKIPALPPRRYDPIHVLRKQPFVVRRPEPPLFQPPPYYPDQAQMVNPNQYPINIQQQQMNQGQHIQPYPQHQEPYQDQQLHHQEPMYPPPPQHPQPYYQNQHPPQQLYQEVNQNQYLQQPYPTQDRVQLEQQRQSPFKNFMNKMSRMVRLPRHDVYEQPSPQHLQINQYQQPQYQQPQYQEPNQNLQLHHQQSNQNLLPPQPQFITDQVYLEQQKQSPFGNMLKRVSRMVRSPHLRYEQHNLQPQQTDQIQNPQHQEISHNQFPPQSPQPQYQQINQIQYPQTNNIPMAQSHVSQPIQATRFILNNSVSSQQHSDISVIDLQVFNPLLL